MIKLQLALSVVLNVVLFAPVIINLVFRGPLSIAYSVTIAAGSFLGWLAFVISGCSPGGYVVCGRTNEKSISRFVGDLAFGNQLSPRCVHGLSGISGWVALHWLTICLTVAAAWLMLMVARLNSVPIYLSNLLRSACLTGRRLVTATRRKCAAIVGGIAVLLSLRTLQDAEATRWWSIVPLLAIIAACSDAELENFLASSLHLGCGYSLQSRGLGVVADLDPHYSELLVTQSFAGESHCRFSRRHCLALVGPSLTTTSKPVETSSVFVP